MITRRFFGLGVAAAITAPAIVKFQSIMPVRSYTTGGFTVDEIEKIAESAIRYYEVYGWNEYGGQITERIKMTTPPGVWIDTVMRFHART